jgi:hypothetical protein
MKKKLPVREFKINPENDSWVSAIAITTTPAIESSFITFNSDVAKQRFSANNERKELLGIAMIADRRIYRNSPEHGEYECFFSAETIREISQVFAQKGFNNNINIEHTDVSADSYVFQSFIVDSKLGINSPTGLGAKDGDWIVGIKCKSDEVYETLKDLDCGFSVEGIFEMLEESFASELDESTILSNYYNALNKILPSA